MQAPGAAEFLQFKGLKMPQDLKLMLNFKVKLASNLQLSPQISQGTVTLQVVPRRKWSGRTNYRTSSSPAGPCKVTADGPPCCNWSPQ